MKLFRALLLTALLILPFAGCAAIPYTDEARAQALLDGLAQFYQTDVLIKTGGMEARAHIYRPDPMRTRVEIRYPERLAGFVYSFGEGGVELQLQSLSFHLDSFAGVSTVPIPRGVSALSSLLIPQAERALPARQNGLWALRGEFDGEVCILFLDAQNGLPVKLLLQSSEVEFVFENFVFLG